MAPTAPEGRRRRAPLGENYFRDQSAVSAVARCVSPCLPVSRWSALFAYSELERRLTSVTTVRHGGRHVGRRRHQRWSVRSGGTQVRSRLDDFLAEERAVGGAAIPSGYVGTCSTQTTAGLSFRAMAFPTRGSQGMRVPRGLRCPSCATLYRATPATWFGPASKAARASTSRSPTTPRPLHPDRSGVRTRAPGAPAGMCHSGVADPVVPMAADDLPSPA